MARGVFLFLLLVAALAAPGTASAANELAGLVQAGTISLRHENTIVRNLAPGTYTLTVKDETGEQNFRLAGPGVNVSTGVEFVGTQTFTVTLRAGSYAYFSDADSYLSGNFTVGTTTTAPSTGSGTRLVATVGPGFTITLTRGGRRVTRLKPGTYTIVVRDRSSAHSFHLRGLGVNKRTGIAFVGTVTWRVKFSRALYRYRCDAHPLEMRSSFRVAA